MPLTLSGTSGVLDNSGAFIAGTSVATNGATTYDFTGIPSWVKRITFNFYNVSSNGTSSWLIQLGTSSGIITTGYFSACNNGPSISSTAGFVIGEDTPSLLDSGSYIISQLNSTTWTGCGNAVRESSTTLKVLSGRLINAGTIDRVRFTMVNGTDLFDSGNVNILYE